MKERAETCSTCENSCGCGCGHHQKYVLLRIILGLIIIGTVFCLGIKIGEIKQYIQSNGGYEDRFQNRGMMMYGGDGIRAMPMMTTTYTTAVSTTTGSKK